MIGCWKLYDYLLPTNQNSFNLKGGSFQMSPKVAKYLGFFYKKKQPNLVYSKGHLRLKNCFITEICSWHFRIRSCRQGLQLPHQLSTAFYIIDPTRRYRIIYSWQAIFFLLSPSHNSLPWTPMRYIIIYLRSVLALSYTSVIHLFIVVGSKVHLIMPGCSNYYTLHSTH